MGRPPLKRKKLSEDDAEQFRRMILERLEEKVMSRADLARKMEEKGIMSQMMVYKFLRGGQTSSEKLGAMFKVLGLKGVVWCE